MTHTSFQDSVLKRVCAAFYCFPNWALCCGGTAHDAFCNVDLARTTDGATPLLLAAQNGHADVVEKLNAAHCILNIPAINGSTVLSIGTLPGHTLALDHDPTRTHSAKFKVDFAVGTEEDPSFGGTLRTPEGHTIYLMFRDNLFCMSQCGDPPLSSSQPQGPQVSFLT